MHYHALCVSACLLCRVASHCSESHRQLCSYPYLQLQQITATTSSHSVPELNQSTITVACRLFTQYMNCTQPFLESCAEETRTHLQSLSLTLGLICGDVQDGNVVHRPCHHQIYTSYSSCKDKQVTAIHNVDLTLPDYKNKLCSAANRYVLCVMTATILGCSLSTANVYYNILNQTITHIFQTGDFQCYIYHPLDVVSLYTTTSSTTTMTTKIAVSTITTPFSSDKTEQWREVSSARKLCSTNVLFFFSVVCVVSKLQRTF